MSIFLGSIFLVIIFLKIIFLGSIFLYLYKYIHDQWAIRAQKQLAILLGCCFATFFLALVIHRFKSISQLTWHVLTTFPPSIFITLSVASLRSLISSFIPLSTAETGRDSPACSARCLVLVHLTQPGMATLTEIVCFVFWVCVCV